MSNSLLLFFNVLLLASIGQVAADMYLPSLPAIASHMMVDAGAVQWSVSVYMWGFALSQLLYGPMSDAVGRRRPLLLGLCILCVGSVICLWADSIGLLIVGRFLQGLGAGSGASLSWVILRDTFEGETMAKYGSYLAMSSIVLMASAPVLGGLLQYLYQWRANFFFLFIYSTMVLAIICMKLPETNRYLNKQHLQFAMVKKNIGALFRHPQFIYYCLIVMISYGGILAWLTVSPILLQQQSGLSPMQFSLATAITGASYGLCNFINSRCVEHFKTLVMIRFGLTMMLLSGITMMILWLSLHSSQAILIVLPAMLFVGSTGFVFSNAIASALNPFPQIAGVAGSIYGALQIIGGALTSAILASIEESNPLPLAICFCLCAMVGIFAFSRLARQK